MTGLREALAGYLDLRRGLGFKLARDEKLLEQFISWLEERGTATVTVTDALAWATLPAGASPGWLRMRITVVRGFATYLATLDPAAEVPPASLLPGGSRRAVPYLYSAADIAALMAQAARLRTPLRPATLRTLIGLLAVTGMRIGEVIALDDGGFDPGQGMVLGPARQARQAPADPAAPHHGHRHPGLPAAARPGVPAPGQRGAAGVCRRHPAAELQRQPHLHPAGPPRGTGGPPRRQPPEAA